MIASLAAPLTLAAALVAQHPGGAPAGAPGMSPEEVARHEAQHLRDIRQVTFGLARAGEGYFSPDGHSIIFQAVPHVAPSIFHHPMPDEDGYQIFLGRLLVEEPAKMVSTGKGRCTCPYFHPSGRSILFASTHLNPSTEAEPPKGPAYSRTSRYRWEFPESMDIFAADLDGKNLVRLTDAPGYDAEGSYSPDGSKIVFTSFRDGDGEIYIMDADGKNPRRITHAKGYDGGPFFSPDGKRIVYRSDRKGNDLLQVYINNTEGRAVAHEQRLRELGTVLAPGQSPRHLRDQQARPRQLRALPDGCRLRPRGADHLPGGLRRPAGLQPRWQAADVDLERPHAGQEEPALHRRLHDGTRHASGGTLIVACDGMDEDRPNRRRMSQPWDRETSSATRWTPATSSSRPT
jgi:hypothetical protein